MDLEKPEKKTSVQVRKEDRQESDPQLAKVECGQRDRSRHQQRNRMRNNSVLSFQEPCFQRYQDLTTIEREHRQQIEESPPNVHPQQIKICCGHEIHGNSAQNQRAQQQNASAQGKAGEGTSQTDGEML